MIVASLAYPRREARAGWAQGPENFGHENFGQVSCPPRAGFTAGSGDDTDFGPPGA